MTLLSLFNSTLRKLSTTSRDHGHGFLGLRARLSRLRRDLLPTDRELDAQYLDGADDLHGLEARMRDLHTPRRHTYGMFRHR